jgi:hypothetical protein
VISRVLAIVAIVCGVLAFASASVLGLSSTEELGVGLTALGVAVLL